MSSKKVEGSHGELSAFVRCGFGWLVLLAEILLFGALGLILFWVFYYYKGLTWNDTKDKSKMYNLHYVFMTAGFIFLNGQAMLMYRLLPFCKKIVSKLVHTFFFALAIACIAIGLLPVFQMREDSTVIHFYSIHSWVGIAAVALFGLQFVMGFISYLLLLCCDNATMKFRQRLLPTHVTFGIIIFNLAVAACLTGFTQTAKARLDGKDGDPDLKDLPEQGIILNTIAAILVALSIVIPYIIRNNSFKRYTTLTIN